MMGTAFLGYVLPYGQMSLWGNFKLALNVYFLSYNIFHINYEECLVFTNHGLHMNLALSNLPFFSLKNKLVSDKTLNLNQNKKINRIRAESRIGPHNKNVISILFGSLLGDGYAEKRTKGNGTRIRFYQEGSHLSYLLFLHKTLADLEYCNPSVPKVQKRLGKKGIVRKIIRFNTWTYSSLNWIHELWYVNGIKVIPGNIGEFLDPLALAVWIMDDGCKAGSGLKLATNSFNYSDCILLVKVLNENFNIKASVQSAGANPLTEQYVIYIWKDSMPLLLEIVEPYVHSSMKYKLSK